MREIGPNFFITSFLKFAISSGFSVDLTWRDVQHLVAATANPEPLSDNPGWKRNGAGLRYNNRWRHLLEGEGCDPTRQPSRQIRYSFDLVMLLRITLHNMLAH